MKTIVATPKSNRRKMTPNRRKLSTASVFDVYICDDFGVCDNLATISKTQIVARFTIDFIGSNALLRQMRVYFLLPLYYKKKNIYIFCIVIEYRENRLKIVATSQTAQKTFYALAIYGMLNNVKQNGSGNAERMSGFVGVRMPAPILVKFSGFAVADGRTPSGLMRKLATDYVAERELHAVPPTPAVQSEHTAQSATQPHHQSPWEI